MVAMAVDAGKSSGQEPVARPTANKLGAANEQDQQGGSRMARSRLRWPAVSTPCAAGEDVVWTADGQPLGMSVHLEGTR